MITNISLWAKEIAIAVIICTLILMIIPNNKNKKYIKVIAGIYILFCVLNPITSRAIDINEYKLDNYISESNEQNKTEETYISSINKEFENKMKENIKEELKTLGYKSNDVDVKFDDDYNLIQINISNVKKYYQINKIKIKKDDSDRKINDTEKEKIKDEISKKYSIDKDKININI